MNIIGITGSSGSGKTYFSKKLGENLENASVINLDFVFFDILNTDSEIKEQIIQKYGERAYDNSGYINISELQNMNNLKFEDFFNIIKDKLDNKILQIIYDNKSRKTENLIIEWFLLPKTKAFQMCDYKVLIAPNEKDRENSLLQRNEDETPEKIKKRTEALPIDYKDYDYDKISINTYQEGCYDKDIEEIKNLERRKKFSEQEIGAKTINTLTDEKDRANERIRHEMLQIQQEEKGKN